MKTAILILTKSGLDLARRLRVARPESTTIFGPSCVVGSCGGPGSCRTFATGEPGVSGWLGPLRLVVPEVWEEFDAIVAVMALGIIVRLVGPLLRDKRRDPALVVVDDAGRFAISVAGGHEAGANDLTLQVAAILGALPVVTTASEAHGLPAVDRIGRDLGWTIERTENLTRVAAAVVRREPVVVWQEVGSPDWWRPFGPWPDHFLRLSARDDLSNAATSAVLVISDRTDLPDLPEGRTLVYRPRSLVAGIGCRRGTTREAIDTWIEFVMNKNGYSTASLVALATVTIKADEPGLIAAASGRGLPLLAFPPEDLADQPGIETPSEQVREKLGIGAVAEPAALRASGASRLLLAKQKGPGVTLALARRPIEDVASYQPKYAGGPKPGA